MNEDIDPSTSALNVNLPGFQLDWNKPRTWFDIVSFLVFVALFIASLIWISKDATKRGKNPVGAIFFALLAYYPISLLWWLWLRPPLLSVGGPRRLPMSPDPPYPHRKPDSFLAGEHALEFGATADILSGLAYVHSEQSEAAALYKRALAIEPDHFMATENLKLLGHAKGNT